MSQHPISVAFESIDADMSPVFQAQLRAGFLAAVSQPEVKEDAMVKVVDIEVGHRGNVVGPDTAVESSPPRHRRMRMAVGLAAAVAIVATTAVIIATHQDPKAVDTSHDPDIARAAVISPSALGDRWTVSHLWGDLTSRSIAESAATVPECERYLDAAFDTASRQAITTGHHFGIPGADYTIWIVTQWVTIFPSKKAASEAMDKIAEPGFAPCFDHVFRRMYGNSEATRLDPVPVTPHGDRQIVIGQHLVFGGEINVDVMNTWVQIGRAVVFVDPSTDLRDSRDPAGRIERTVSAATKALEAALAGSHG